MPNLDGIIWQNPTVMKSLAPIISDVTKRMEDTIKDKAKQDLALQAKNQELEYRKKIAEQKLKTENAKKAATLPTGVPRTMLPYESSVLQKAQEDFYRRLGAANLKIDDPAAVEFANEWNQIQQLRLEAEQRNKDYLQAYEKSQLLDPNDYDVVPDDYVVQQMDADETYFQEQLAQNKTWQEIYANYQRRGYELPKKKAPVLQLDATDLPDLVIETRTRTVGDEKGGKRLDKTSTEQVSRFKEDLKVMYNAGARPKMVEFIKKNYTKDDGTIDFDKASIELLPLAQTRNMDYNDTDIEPREKVTVTVNNPTPRGYSSGKTAKKKRAEGVSYAPQSLKSSEKGTTFPVWYQAEGETLPSKITQVAILSDKNNRKIHVLDETGAPVENYPELEKVSDVVYWMPIANNGYLRRSKEKDRGIAPHQVEGFSVVPYAQYVGEDKKTYYVPATAIDSDYEIIEEGDAKADEITYRQSREKANKVKDKKERDNAPPLDKNKDRRNLN